MDARAAKAGVRSVDSVNQPDALGGRWSPVFVPRDWRRVPRYDFLGVVRAICCSILDELVARSLRRRAAFSRSRLSHDALSYVFCPRLMTRCSIGARVGARIVGGGFGGAVMALILDLLSWRLLRMRATAYASAAIRGALRFADGCWFCGVS